MLLIFGTRAYATVLAMVRFVCSVCHVDAAQRVVREATKFTFFFIPTFTVSTRHYTVCTNCGASISISAGKADEYARGPQASANSPLPAMPTAPYEQVPD